MVACWSSYVYTVIRVRELEGKVRELESSMARMGEQHDITMELVETWRNQKETVSVFDLESRGTW